MFSLSLIFMESSSSARSATASTPLAATRSASSLTKATNSSDLATKSVSERSCTMDDGIVGGADGDGTLGCLAVGPLGRPARPCSRSQVTALSMSPSFSSRARFASSMPTPVS